MRYLVIIEKGRSSWGAHVPDLPGCIAVGATRDEAFHLIREAIALHVEDLKGLSRVFGNSARFWLNAQRAVDAWEAAQA